MKRFIKENENLFWAGTLLVFFFVMVISVSYFRDYAFTEEFIEGEFINYSYHTSVTGKINSTREFCKILVQGETLEISNEDDKCEGLMPGDKVKLLYKKQYAKFFWQKHYSFKSRELLSFKKI